MAHFHGNSIKKEIHGHEGPVSGFDLSCSFEGQKDHASIHVVSQEEKTDGRRAEGRRGEGKTELKRRGKRMRGEERGDKRRGKRSLSTMIRNN